MHQTNRLLTSVWLSFALSGCGLWAGPNNFDTGPTDCRDYGCDGNTDTCIEDLTNGGSWFCDTDEDGDGSYDSQDCDNSDATVYPGAEEQCDEIDRDCDGNAFTTECDDIFGPKFRFTMLNAESRYNHDPGGIGGIGSSDPDLYVEFGENLGSLNEQNCYTEEVEDAFVASWNEHCDFTFQNGDNFKIALMDNDTVGAKLIEKWTWEGFAEMKELLSQPAGEYQLQDENNVNTWLWYRIDRLD
ncbi:MAG: hypothetical protein GWP91_17505 [Rhodobacterales bacterium]|nr:hypothetical protein [Rhodobacterales bacterium]